MKYSFLKKIVGNVVFVGLLLQSTAPFIAVATVPQQKISSQKASPSASQFSKAQFIADVNLNKLIRHIVEDATAAKVDNPIGEPIKRCYQSLSQGTQVLPIEDVWQAMPDILRYAVEYHTRAPRPDAPKVTSNSAIVGPGGACELTLTQILGLLAAIKNQITCLDTTCTATLICDFDDLFNQVFTAIQGCCENLTELIIDEHIDTRTIIIDAIDECCESVREDIFNTQTTILNALDNLDFTNCCTVLEADIADLSEQLEECCENLTELIIDEHIETRSIIIDAIEECCESVREDIFNTQTIIIDAIEECCEEIREDIFNTQTIIIEALCLPTPLTQEDAVAGVIDLTVKGNYKFCEDITADLIISNSCISVDMNDRKLFGTVCILGGDVILKNGFIKPPAPTTVAEAAIPAVWVKNSVAIVRLLNLTITNEDSTDVDDSNNGLPSRDGIVSDGLKTFIIDCCIQTGAGAPGGDAQADGPVFIASRAPVPPFPAGTGGASGCGIISNLNKAQIINTIVTTGNGGAGGNSQIGTPSLENAANGGASGTGIKIFGDLSFIVDTKVYTGNGGNGGISACGDGGNGGNSGDGICNESQSTEIKAVTVRTGDAGNGGTGDTGDEGGNGGNSGNAIKTQGTQIVNVVLTTGNAGNGANAGIGGTGGNAGHGLLVLDACNTEAREIVVDRTGFGGNGGNSTLIAAGGAAGNGGDAVHITQGSKHTEVRNSTFSNTGRGGTGGTGTPAGADGLPGRAVTDLNNDLCSLDPECETDMGPSAIFSNFAYAIADNDIRYLINGKVKESGKASDKSCNRLDNVYVECNVDVVFDFCQEIGDLLECCTAVSEKIDDLSDQLEECCEAIREDIFNSQTTIINVINNLDFTNCCTAILDAINNLDLTNCCTALLSGIDDLSDQLEECCEDIRTDIFNSQTTILDAINNLDLTNCCTALLSGIDDLSDQLEECCEDIRTDIFNSQTTILDAINNLDLTNCCTILVDISDQLEECCENIQGALCTPILIHQSDFTSSTFVISSPGLYRFAEDITFFPGATNQSAIQIISDDVILDLCGHTLSQGNAVSGINGIQIQGGPSSSPRSNVEVYGGTVSGFTRAGISVGENPFVPSNAACIRIRLHDLDVVACLLRGIELLGTVADRVVESELNGCNIINCCKNSFADFALYLLRCSSVSVNKSSLYNNGALAIANFAATNVQNCIACVLTDITVDFNTAQNLIAFNLTACESCIFTNCVVSNCFATGALRGFEFVAGVSNTKNILRLCNVIDNSAFSGPLIGYELLPGVIFNQLVECIAVSNTTVSAVATANCFGFNYDQAERCTTFQCRSLRNLAPSDGTTNIAVGFNIITTGGAGTGNVACEWVRCDAVGNTGVTAARSFGIRAVSGANGNVFNAYLGNVAYRNGPVGTAISTRQITADGGLDSFVGGVPFNSIRTVTSLNNFNGVNDQYSNIRVAD